MPKQEKTPKKKSKKKTPQKSEESEYPAMDQDEMNRLLQNAIEHAQAQLEQKHADHIKALEADREAKIKVGTEVPWYSRHCLESRGRFTLYLSILLRPHQAERHEIGPLFVPLF